MKRLLGAFGLVAACAACCAMPFAIPAIAGLTLSGIGFAAMGKQALACLLAIAALGVAALIFMRHKQKAKACEIARCGPQNDERRRPHKASVGVLPGLRSDDPA